MPVYRYKNVDAAKCAILEKLINQLLGQNANDPAVQAVTDHVFHAHECSLIDTIANSHEISRLIPVDPAILKQINDVIATCK